MRISKNYTEPLNTAVTSSIGADTLNMKNILFILILLSGFSNASSLPSAEGDKLQEIVDLFKKGSKHEAQQQLRVNENRLIEVLNEAKDGESYLLLGRAYFYAEMDVEAEKFLKTALIYNPALSDAHFFIGLIKMYSKELDRAGASFKNAIKLDDSKEHYFLELGRIQEKNNKPDLALEQYKKALDINELNFTANFNLANIYSDKKDNEKAEVHYLAALKKKPNDVDLNYNLGQLYQNTSQHVKAKMYFSKVIELEPTDWKAIRKIVQLNQSIGDSSERDKAIKKIYSLWRTSNVDELVKQGFFIREQSFIESGKLFVLEYFDLRGERARKYVFKITDPVTGNNKFEISLGSYDATTRGARALDEIGPNDRLYHLDGYTPNGSHHTYAFFNSLPNYDDVRELVFEILNGGRTAISSNVPNSVNK